MGPVHLTMKINICHWARSCGTENKRWVTLLVLYEVDALAQGTLIVPRVSSMGRFYRGSLLGAMPLYVHVRDLGKDNIMKAF